jgi:two-component sensor histidine kinase
MQKTIRELPPGTVLAATLIAAAFPLVFVEIFPELRFVIARPSYLVFHNISEFFSVMVSLSMFGIGWYTYEQSKDRHALFLSTAFLGIGLMDFMHTLANAAMPPFVTPNSSNKSTQFWIAVRLFEAVAFLVSAYVYSERPTRWLSKRVLMTCVLLVCFFVFTGITFFPSYMPATFVPGAGLTPFKKVCEYLIIGLLCAATLSYWRRIVRTGDRLLNYYAAAFVICLFSELPLAVYSKVFDTHNVLGHMYKVAAFFLIYHGIYRASVKAPYLGLTLVGEKLKGEIVERKRTEEALRQAHNNLEFGIRERTAELAQSNAQLRTEVEDRRKAEEALREREERLRGSLNEKEVLLKEIHHRVKNNMQVISSLVALQADESQDTAMRAVLQDVTHRVRSMALVHEKLYQSADLARVEFDEYARSLLNYLWCAHGTGASTVRLALDLKPVSLSVNTAVPCGLILNELVSNALKHAFRGLGHAEGVVAVSLRGDAQGLVRLCVRDNGTGLPAGFDWSQARTLGLRLVQMLAGQLHAAVEVSNTNGTEFTITFEGPSA